MTERGRAAVFEAPGEPFVIRTYELRTVEPGEVLVRVRLSSICRSDIHSWEGKRPSPCPGLLGHEIIGTIEALGASVAEDLSGEVLAVGDRVTWTEYFGCGRCRYCTDLDMPQKCPQVRKYGHESADTEPHLLGGFAEFCYLQPGTGILKLPDVLSDQVAVPLNCAAATMVCVTETAGIVAGETVVVQGLGLMGLYGAALAKAAGAGRVIGLDVEAARLEKAHRFGVDEAINVGELTGESLVQRVRALSLHGAADVVIEACGVPAVVPQGIAMLRPGGRYVLAGAVFPNADATIDVNRLVAGCITLTGVHNYHPRHLVAAVDFAAAHHTRFPLDEIVEATFSLDETSAAFRAAAVRSVLRAAIAP